MALYTSISEILEGIKDKIIQEYRNKNIKASGTFERNITISRQGRYKTVLTLPFYSVFITRFKSNQGGRGPGKAPPPSAIEQWIKDKGLNLRDLGSGRFATKTSTKLKQVAFLISRKIAGQGTDIYQGKRHPIDLDKIINNELDYRGDELGDRILSELNI